jgi:predicted glycoside hydrolase/deacetylase ChbG (UPF0249 family)
MKRLIVNADDFGRTEGINAGTIETHRNGVVTSATAMILEAHAAAGIARMRSEAPRLSLGLHCVLTGGGMPASDPASLPTLAPHGRFARNAEALPERIDAEEIRRELSAQIDRFTQVAGRPPSHLDSHHHSALHLSIQPVFSEVARARGLPVRGATPSARDSLRESGLSVPDAFFDAFYGEGATFENLEAILDALPDGTSELMCHPGHPDEELLAGSTYAHERGREIDILCDPRIRDRIRRGGVQLISFDEI